MIVWVLISIFIGVLFPIFNLLASYSSFLLAIMIGSISLTLSFESFAKVNWGLIFRLIIGYLVFPLFGLFIGYIIASGPEVTLGLVLISTVTPEFVSPVMTKLAHGSTDQSMIMIVIIGILSVFTLPIYLSIVSSTVYSINTLLIIQNILLSLLFPLILGLLVHSYKKDRVAKYENFFITISSIMVLVLVCILVATYRGLLREDLALLPIFLIAVFSLNALGYLLGFILSSTNTFEEQISSVLSSGMKDFAVAAVLILSLQLPSEIALLAILFGIVELITSSLLAFCFKRTMSH